MPERSDRSVIAYLAFLGVLLATGIDIALPAFSEIEQTHGSTNTSLVVTVYVIGIALGQLVYGPLADRYGRRPAILAGLVLYAVGAAASALAPTFGLMLAGRVVWGLGAAAPTGLRTAIARDLYKGDDMARIVTIIMAVFLLGPVFVPLLGEGLIRIGPWELVFWFGTVLAAVGAFWTIRFGETLAPEHRRPLKWSPFVAALRAIVTTRVTAGHIVANVFFTAAFLIFLGSAQPAFERVFDRADQFAVLFAVAGLAIIPPLLLNNRWLAAHGSRRMSLIFGGLAVVVAAAGVAITLGADGTPSFWLWYVWLVVTGGCITLANPAVQALALEPMGEHAGTASALMFFSGFAFGAVLAALFDRLVETTVSPFVVGMALYTTLAFIVLAWAGSGLRQPATAQ